MDSENVSGRERLQIFKDFYKKTFVPVFKINDFLTLVSNYKLNRYNWLSISHCWKEGETSESA
jgi:hypothetical protein